MYIFGYLFFGVLQLILKLGTRLENAAVRSVAKPGLASIRESGLPGAL